MLTATVPAAAPQEKQGGCTTGGCQADTGYLSKDGEGQALIINISGGTDVYSGYLYP